MKHVIDIRDFDREALEALFKKVDGMLEKPPVDALKGKIMAALFYEPSTRTRLSFESAMNRLGGAVIGTENAGEFSSAAKGETLEDSIRVVAGYADVIVIRHPEVGSAERASSASPVPVINAGDGAGQHPTQALLDAYTIQRETGGLDGKKVALVGDLKNGRTARSLAYLLSKFTGVEIMLVSPKELAMGQDIKEYLSGKGMTLTESEDLAGALAWADVVYQTRIQKERFASEEEYLKFKGRFVITRALADTMKDGAIIMHPLPRVDEIAPEVDDSPHARYFEQARYGLYVRMALLHELLH
ncbi:MAG TPA: aspartate carbamoyltransferase [Candidatus Paceibacterota bacterium]|nr:aspartate carbamoyltransferase [Candidatus Paceibacterota bacterium]